MTLISGSRPKQRLTKVQAKSEVQESHFMLPRMQKSVGNETTHSQVGSHFGGSDFGNQSSDELLNSHKAISRAKTHWIETFLISLESS